MKNITRNCLLILAIIWPAWSWAAVCTISTPDGGPLVYTISGFNPPKFDPNVAVGTVIYSHQTWATTPNRALVTCQNGLNLATYVGKPGVVGKYNAYPTSIGGVGIRFSYPGSQVGGYFPTSSMYSQSSIGVGDPSPTILVELIKTGPITSGGTIAGEVAAEYVNNGAFQYISYILGAGAVVQPMTPTCVATSPPPVSLGNIAKNKFTGIGSVTEVQPFNIGMNCSGGTTGALTNIHMTLTDQGNLANRSDTLSLASTSTAAGIGIQVLNGATVIQYGPDSSQAGTQNQWKALSEIKNGIYTIPLTARYIQVAPTVEPGTANGRATFTISYQ